MSQRLTMCNERIGKIIFMLERIRERVPMYVNPASPSNVITFVDGFHSGCFALGLKVPLGTLQQVTEERGWTWSAIQPISEMRERGLTDEEIADEWLAINIDAWRLMNEAASD